MDDNEGLLLRVTAIASNVIGSWWMIAFQTAMIGTWLFFNLVVCAPANRVDDQHFDTLRLVLALQSVYTAPLILMAQRRVSAKDRQVLHDIDGFERQAMELRLQAMERRIRLEDKVDKLLARGDDER